MRKKRSPKMHRLGSFQFFLECTLDPEPDSTHIRATSSACQLRRKFEESAH